MAILDLYLQNERFEQRRGVQGCIKPVFKSRAQVQNIGRVEKVLLKKEQMWLGSCCAR